jgi:hypothetical protein
MNQIPDELEPLVNKLVKKLTPVVKAIQETPGSLEVKSEVLSNVGTKMLLNEVKPSLNTSGKNKTLKGGNGNQNNNAKNTLTSTIKSCGYTGLQYVLYRKGMNTMRGKEVPAEELAYEFVTGAMIGLLLDVCPRLAKKGLKKTGANVKINSFVNAVGEKTGMNLRKYIARLANTRKNGVKNVPINNTVSNASNPASPKSTNNEQ